MIEGKKTNSFEKFKENGNIIFDSNVSKLSETQKDNKFFDKVNQRKQKVKQQFQI